MQSITRNITDLAVDERSVIERFIGRHLTDEQRLVHSGPSVV